MSTSEADLYHALGKLEGKIDSQTQMIADIQAQVRLTNGRVTALERDRVVLGLVGKGFWLVVAGVVAFIGAIARSLI